MHGPQANEIYRTRYAWAAEWYSCSKHSGVSRYLIRESGVPVLFRTKQLAKEWIDKHYGYIRHRESLRREPHGWRLPRPVRVEIKTSNSPTAKKAQASE